MSGEQEDYTKCIVGIVTQHYRKDGGCYRQDFIATGSPPDYDDVPVRLIQPYAVMRRPCCHAEGRTNPIGRLEGVVPVNLKELIRRPPDVEELLAAKILTSPSKGLVNIRWEIVGFDSDNPHVVHIAVSAELVDLSKGLYGD